LHALFAFRLITLFCYAIKFHLPLNTQHNIHILTKFVQAAFVIAAVNSFISGGAQKGQKGDEGVAGVPGPPGPQGQQGPEGKNGI